MNVDVLGVLGRTSEVHAHIARDPAQAASGVASEHSNGWLGSYHDVLAELLKEGISRLGDLSYSILNVPNS
jgi:hypothetical protein